MSVGMPIFILFRTYIQYLNCFSYRVVFTRPYDFSPTNIKYIIYLSNAIQFFTAFITFNIIYLLSISKHSIQIFCSEWILVCGWRLVLYFSVIIYYLDLSKCYLHTWLYVGEIFLIVSYDKTSWMSMMTECLSVTFPISKRID